MIGRHILNMIVCTTKDGLIGDATPKEGTNGLLWHVPSELREYKINTVGHIVVFGANTAKFVPIELMKKNRHVIVLDWGMSLEEELKKVPKEYAISKVFICGGYSIYKHFLENYEVDVILKSELKDIVEIAPCNTPLYFPNPEDYGFIKRAETNHDEFKVCTYMGENRLNARASLFLRSQIFDIGHDCENHIEKFDIYFETIQKAKVPVIVYYGDTSFWSIEDEDTNSVIIDHQMFDSIVDGEEVIKDEN